MAKLLLATAGIVVGPGSVSDCGDRRPTDSRPPGNLAMGQGSIGQKSLYFDNFAGRNHRVTPGKIRSEWLLFWPRW
jgi:hypothetical protein